MSKPPAEQGFVLRCGVVIPFNASDVVATAELLRQAIVAESLQAAEQKQAMTWDDVIAEVAAEITHVITNAPATIAQTLLITLLSDKVFDLLISIAHDHDLEPPTVH